MLAGVLAGAAVGYAAVHRAVWGGWTVYASGDHFERSGEFGVVGVRPDYAGRTTRLLGLLVDRDFGLAAWQPGLAAAGPGRRGAAGGPPARLDGAGGAAGRGLGDRDLGRADHARLLVAGPAARRGASARGPGDPLLAGPAAPPGSCSAPPPSPPPGVAGYATLLVTGYAGDTTWVLAPDELALHRPAGLLLPDDRDLTALDRAKYAGWLVAAGVAAGVAALAAARRAGTGRDREGAAGRAEPEPATPAVSARG